MKKKFPLSVLAARAFPDFPKESLLSLILCGDLRVGDEWCRDPKALFSADLPISLNADAVAKFSAAGEDVPPKPYVSRAGYKLERAFDAWNVEVEGRVWLDAGSSTGGFTHLLLLRGAKAVHAVDVGYNILDYRLRRLKRVLVHERCNLMTLDSSALDPPAQAAVADLSFRSVEGAASRLFSLCSEAEVYVLLKPQFELKYLARSAEGFKGVVDEKTGREVLFDLARRLAREGVFLKALLPAGLRGRKGNLEYCARLGLADAGGIEDAAGLSESVIDGLFSGSSPS